MHLWHISIDLWTSENYKLLNKPLSRVKMLVAHGQNSEASDLPIDPWITPTPNFITLLCKDAAVGASQPP